MNAAAEIKCVTLFLLSPVSNIGADERFSKLCSGCDTQLMEAILLL